MKQKFLSLSLALASFTSVAQVDYTLTLLQPEHHLAEIKAEFTAKSGQSYLDLKLPSWRTGRYVELNLANGVRDLQVLSADGKTLPVEKIEKSTWRVQLNGATNVHAQYQVYANELGLRSRHIDDTHAFIDASGFFMFHDAERNDPVTVSLNVPEQWNSVSGLTSLGPHTFTAANYDVLIDSPIETGINQHHQFTVADQQYELVIWGESNLDVKKAIEDLTKLVKTYQTIWPSVPYQRYVFMVHATTDAKGATEHINSTIIQRKRFSFASRDDYLDFIATAAHEFIHTWNVKAYRPEGLVPYNYISPNYSDLLWVSEGSTSYFEHQLLLRAGIMTTKEFYKDLAKRIERHLNTPGRNVQSVAQSSFDQWIAQGGDHGLNYSVNIYSEGFLASWLLDFSILNDTKLKRSYRDLHAKLYERHALPKAFNNNDMMAIAKELTGKDYQAFWQANVFSPMHIDFPNLLEQVGLRIERETGNTAAVDTGFVVKNQGGLDTISHVRKESSAWNAGLTTDDVLVALNGLKLMAGELNDRLKPFKVGDTVELSFFRRDRLMTKTLVLGDKDSKGLKVEQVAKPTRAQKAMYKAWLGIDYPE